MTDKAPDLSFERVSTKGRALFNAALVLSEISRGHMMSARTTSADLPEVMLLTKRKTKAPPKAPPSGKTIADLQETLLKAALLNQPLPGSERPLRLSDLAFILRHPHIYLSDENLAGKISVEGLPQPLRVMTRENLEEEARQSGDVAYLHFQPAEETEDGAIRLTLEGKLALQDTSQHPLGLSSIQVKFRKVGARWESTDEPVAMAS